MADTVEKISAGVAVAGGATCVIIGNQLRGAVIQKGASNFNHTLFISDVNAPKDGVIKISDMIKQLRTDMKAAHAGEKGVSDFSRTMLKIGDLSNFEVHHISAFSKMRALATTLFEKYSKDAFIYRQYQLLDANKQATKATPALYKAIHTEGGLFDDLGRVKNAFNKIFEYSNNKILQDMNAASDNTIKAEFSYSWNILCRYKNDSTLASFKKVRAHYAQVMSDLKTFTPIQRYLRLEATMRVSVVSAFIGAIVFCVSKLCDAQHKIPNQL